MDTGDATEFDDHAAIELHPSRGLSNKIVLALRPLGATHSSALRSAVMAKAR